MTEDMFLEEIPELVQQQLPIERSTDVMQVVLDLRYGLTDNFTIGLFPRWSTIWASSSINPSTESKVRGQIGRASCRERV